MPAGGGNHRCRRPARVLVRELARFGAPSYNRLQAAATAQKAALLQTVPKW